MDFNGHMEYSMLFSTVLARNYKHGYFIEIKKAKKNLRLKVNECFELGF